MWDSSLTHTHHTINQIGASHKYIGQFRLGRFLCILALQLIYQQIIFSLEGCQEVFIPNVPVFIFDRTLELHLDCISGMCVCICIYICFFLFFLRSSFQLFQWVPCTVHRTHTPLFSTKFSLKMGLTTLFTYLKIILLQCFQFLAK